MVLVIAGVAVVGVVAWFASARAPVAAPPTPPPQVEPTATTQPTTPPRDASSGVGMSPDAQAAFEAGAKTASKALGKDFFGAAAEGASYVGREVARTSVGDEAAPWIATGSTALMYVVSSAGGIAAASGPGAFLAVTALLIAVNVTAIVDTIILAVGVGEWAALAEQIATLRNAGRAREAQELFIRGVTEKRIDRLMRQSLTDHFTVTNENRRFLYAGYPDLPAPLSAAELAAHPEQWPDRIVLKYSDGLERSCDAAELMRLAVQDCADAREWALLNGVPGLVVERVTERVLFSTVERDVLKVATQGPRDVRDFEPYATARAHYLGWCRLVAQCAPWIDSGAVVARYLPLRGVPSTTIPGAPGDPWLLEAAAGALTPEEAAVDRVRDFAAGVTAAVAKEQKRIAESFVSDLGGDVSVTEARTAARRAGMDDAGVTRVSAVVLHRERQEAAAQDRGEAGADWVATGQTTGANAASRSGAQGADANAERRAEAGRTGRRVPD